jgi:cell pole-organizing protein PopZ
MTQPAKSQEPSMEEILASIRRIIADDDTTKTVPRAEAPPPPSAQPVQPEPPPPPPPPPPPRPPVASPRMVAPASSPPEVEPKIAPMPPPMPAPASSASMAAAAPPAAEDVSPDILDLTESMTAAMRSAPAPQFRTIDGSSDLSFDEEPELPAASEHGGNERSDLMSRATSAAVDSAFNTLAQTVLVQNARTLEDLVREMLRPMLKSWLDDNLPSMVERLIRAEIERVSRGR